jgi:hypothetical protein
LLRSEFAPGAAVRRLSVDPTKAPRHRASMDPTDPADLRESVRRLRLALTECAARLEEAGRALESQGRRYVADADRYRQLAAPP